MKPTKKQIIIGVAIAAFVILIGYFIIKTSTSSLASLQNTVIANITNAIKKMDTTKDAVNIAAYKQLITMINAGQFKADELNVINGYVINMGNVSYNQAPFSALLASRNITYQFGGTFDPKTGISGSANADPYSQYDGRYSRIVTFDASNPITQGMMGDQIKAFQNYLNKNENAHLTVDGIWGTDTQTVFLAAKFPDPSNPGQIYTKLTQGLWNSLNLNNY